VIADIQDKMGQAIADKLGENASYFHCDVTNEDNICNLIETAVSKYGHLDIMYNNAGIVDSPLMNILESDKSDLERIVGVNLVGGFLGAKHAARVMIPRQRLHTVYYKRCYSNWRALLSRLRSVQMWSFGAGKEFGG
jgi:NAD(P)-dependent dehydrogenase (short-subunit alcohol dehydrogenase family)